MTSPEGVTPEELATICLGEEIPRDPSLLEPLAGPLPVSEGGEILEPLSVPMPAAGGGPERVNTAGGGPRRMTCREEAAGPAVVMESFWRFGSGGSGPRRGRIMDWEERR